MNDITAYFKSQPKIIRVLEGSAVGALVWVGYRIMINQPEYNLAIEVLIVVAFLFVASYLPSLSRRYME